MEKTSIHFNNKGQIKETSLLTPTTDGNTGKQTLTEEVPKREKGNINFEPPRDGAENSEAANQEKQMIENYIAELDRKQDEIIKLLKRIEERLPTFAGRIVIKGT